MTVKGRICPPLSETQGRKRRPCLGGGFKYFIFLLPIWGNDPIWLYDIFQMVWNYQLDDGCHEVCVDFKMRNRQSFLQLSQASVSNDSWVGWKWHVLTCFFSNKSTCPACNKNLRFNRCGRYWRKPFLAFVGQLPGGGEVAFVLASKSCAGGFEKFAQAISQFARSFFGQGGWVSRGLLLAGENDDDDDDEEEEEEEEGEEEEEEEEEETSILGWELLLPLKKHDRPGFCRFVLQKGKKQSPLQAMKWSMINSEDPQDGKFNLHFPQLYSGIRGSS